MRQVRLHQNLTSQRVDHQPAVSFRDVLLIQHTGKGGQCGQDVGSRQSDRGGSRAEVVTTGDSARSCTLVSSRDIVPDTLLGGSAEQNAGVDRDFHLHRSVVGEHIHQLRLRLVGNHVIHLEGEILGAVNRQLNGARGRNLVRQGGANLVVVDGDVRTVVDNNLVAQTRDFTFVRRVGDFAENSRLVELLVQLGGPQGRDERTRGVVTRKCAGCADQRGGSGYCTHVVLLITRKQNAPR